MELGVVFRVRIAADHFGSNSSAGNGLVVQQFQSTLIEGIVLHVGEDFTVVFELSKIGNLRLQIRYVISVI